MRLSDQSACLVPICLSYSLFIYFHPDMQGIPDKMASLVIAIEQDAPTRLTVGR